MGKPILVIVGRPNVGKSTLFNRLVRHKAAIVEDTPGVTRDRNYMDAEIEDRHFTAVDTGGFYPKHDDNIFTQIKEQALFAIEEADVIIHLLDARDGLNPYDADLAEVLRESGRTVITVVNKIDGPKAENLLHEFFSLGIESLIGISAENGYGYDDLEERLLKVLPEYADAPAEYPRVAVVGRPNVGKSTLINALIGKKRLLVSPVAGTTRDSIDSLCSYYKRHYTLVDTAGIRRKDKHGYSIERFAMVRTLRAIDRCDVAVILVDASVGLVTEDQRIAGLVNDAGKGAIFLLNKWDLVEDPDKTLKELRAVMDDKLWFFSHAPVLTTSGLDRKRITKVFDLIDGIIKEREKRIPTPELNRFLEGIKVSSLKGKQVKLLYMTQTRTSPPEFVFFTNRPEGIKRHTLRFMEAQLRERYGFDGTPIRIIARERR